MFTYILPTYICISICISITHVQIQFPPIFSFILWSQFQCLLIWKCFFQSVPSPSSPVKKKKNLRHCDNYKLNFWKKLRVNWNGKFLSGVWQIVCKMLFLEYQVIFCNFFRNVWLVFQIWIIVCHWVSEDTLFRWKSYCF